MGGQASNSINRMESFIHMYMYNDKMKAELKGELFEVKIFQAKKIMKFILVDIANTSNNNYVHV